MANDNDYRNNNWRSKDVSDRNWREDKNFDDRRNRNSDQSNFDGNYGFQGDRTNDPYRYRDESGGINNSDRNRDWRSYDKNEDRNSMQNSRSGADYGSYGRGSQSATPDINDRGYSRGADYGSTNRSDQSDGRSADQWGFGRDNRVGSQSYDWGSKQYGSRDINDRNFGREWDKGSSLTPNPTRSNRSVNFNDDFVARSAGLESGRNHIGRGPKNYRRSDDRIKEDVSDVLERHPEIDASEIEVDVKEGVVSLRGSVEDRHTKRMAEDTVEHIYGVKDVRNELSVNKSLFERAKEFLMGDSTAPTEKATSTKSRH